jgi:hypothetical protein
MTLSTTDERTEAAEALEEARAAYFDAIGTRHEADRAADLSRAEAAAEALSED